MRTRTALRLLKKIPPVVAAYYPPTLCSCGCGALFYQRKMFDALAGRVRAGDSMKVVAHDYGVPSFVVRAVAKWWRE